MRIGNRTIKYLLFVIFILSTICLLLFYKLINQSTFTNVQPHLQRKQVDIHPHVDENSNNGKSLELYTIPGETKNKSDSLNNWIFQKTSNKRVDCGSLFGAAGRGVSRRTQTSIIITFRNNFRNALKRASESCNKFIHNSGYITSPLTKTEASFPIAYSLLLFKDAAQFEIFLRTIYRPQNVYCVHIDKKSTAEFRTNVETIVQCFDNVFVTSHSTDVIWGQYSVLEPEITCLKELWENKIKWKYFINLTGQELTLRTNYELVKILTSYGGANNIEAMSVPRGRLDESGPPPHGLKAVKGAVHVVLSRDFVDFLLHNKIAIDVLEWSKKVRHPDEILFSTLNYNKRLAAPGSYKGESKTSQDKNPFLVRLKKWDYEQHCFGKSVHSICILVTEDLPMMAASNYLFANKAYFRYNPEVLMCMQELLYNRTADEYNGHRDFNVSYYASLDFVKNHF